MPHESEKTSRRDARGALERALEDTRRRAEAIRRGSGLFASTRLAAEIEALREHAEAAGLLREFPLLREAPDAFGFEHQVWFSRDEGEAARVLKATYENSFGCLPGQGESLPCQYLERLVLQNQIFGDDLILEGVEEVRPGVYRVITSQPAVEGRFASAGEVREYSVRMISSP